LQRFVSDAPWAEDKMATKYRSIITEDLGSPDGAMIFDESGFIKKGKDSIGVSKQYCGTIGKVDNCQVGVFAGYVSEYGYALVDKRLFIPEKWFADDYSGRRNKCKLPEDTVFKTKPQLAAEMLTALEKENILPFKYVLADSVYGERPEFISAVESMPDKTYFVSVSKDTQCWLKRPITVSKSYRWGGKTRTKTILVDQDSKPLAVEDLAKNIND
jgi:SRSO17 transposase